MLKNRNSQYKNPQKLESRIYLHNHFSANKYDFNRWLFDHLPKTPNLNILELGCGTGILWIKNSDRVPSSWNLTLTDFSPEMVQKTKENLSRIKNKIILDVADAQNVPYKDSSFDIVIANHMLYHIPDRKQALSEIKRVLKPKGTFFASTIGRNHMKELSNIMTEFDSGLQLWDKEFLEEFNLENGAGQLKKFFSNVKRGKFPDKLIVPKVKPLINYVTSTRNGKSLTGKRLANFTYLVKSKLKNGPIVIKKEVGLFIANNG